MVAAVNHQMAQQQPQQTQGQPPQVEDPLIVAEQFVRQYYLLLQNSPWLLHHLYKEHSVYTVQYQSTPTASVRGAVNIAHYINESLPNPITQAQEGKEHSCEIKNIRYMQQVSIQGSLVVSVSGSLAHPQSGQSQRFQQTFVLASEGVANAYYVHNDMCSYEPETVATTKPVVPLPTPAANPAPTSASAQTAPKPGPQGIVPRSPPGAQTITTQGSSSPSREGSPKFGTVPEELQPSSLELGAPTITPAEQGKGKKEGKKKEPKAATADKAEDKKAAPEPEAPKGPASWASMAAKAPPPPPPAPPAPPKSEKKTKEDKKEEEDKDGAEEPTATASKEAPTQSRKEKNTRHENSAEQLEASIFVSGVPSSCDEEKLRKIFGEHGEVVKVSLKTEKHFAIIDYSNAQGATEALSKAAIRIDGSTMKIEARRKEERPSRKKGGAKGGERGENKNMGNGKEEKARGRGRGEANKGGGRKPKVQNPEA